MRDQVSVTLLSLLLLAPVAARAQEQPPEPPSEPAPDPEAAPDDAPTPAAEPNAPEPAVEPAPEASEPKPTPSHAASTATTSSPVDAPSGTDAGHDAGVPGRREDDTNEDGSKEDETAFAGGEYRRVNGHTFISPLNIPSALLNTSFTSAQGFGVLQFDGISVISGDPKRSNIFAYYQVLGAQIGIVNRVAIDVAASGVAAVGGDLEDILVIGALANVNAQGGVKVRIFTLDDVGLQLTGAAYVGYDRNFQVSPGNFIGEVLANANEVINGQRDFADFEDRLLIESEALEISPAVLVAEGVGPFGVQVGVRPNIGVVGENSTTDIDAGAEIEFDFAGLTAYFPIALMAEYMLTHDFGAATQLHNVGGGLFYSGRRDLSLGASGIFSFAEGQRFFAGALGIQYFF